MRKPGLFSVSTELTVPFFDVDSMHIVWHGHYVKYLEIARCALLDRLDYGYLVMREHGHAWPVVQLAIKYVKPATFGNLIRVDAHLVEWESCLKINYNIYDTASGTRLTRASTTQVAVAIASGEMQFQTPPCWQARVHSVLESV